MAITSVTLPFSTNTTGIAVGNNDTILRIRDIRPDIPELNRPDSIFYKILSMLNVEAPATSPKYEWAEDDVPADYTFVTNAETAGATTIEVTDSLGLTQNSIVVVHETGELILVDTVPGSTSFTCQASGRGFAGTAAKAITAGAKISFLNNVLPELANANGGNSTLPSEFFNYIEMFSQTFQVSELQDNTTMLDGVGQVPYSMIKTAIIAQQKLNNSLLYGKRGRVVSPNASADGIIYTSDGFFNKVSTNELNVANNNGTLSWPVLNHFLRPLFQANSSSNTKTMLAGVNTFAYLSRISYDRHNFRAEPEDVLGTTLTQIRTDEGGTVQILLDRHGVNSDEAIVIDFAHAALVEMQGMEGMVWKQNIQDNDSHVRKDELWGSGSLKLQFEDNHGIIRGVTSQF